MHLINQIKQLQILNFAKMILTPFRLHQKQKFLKFIQTNNWFFMNSNKKVDENDNRKSQQGKEQQPQYKHALKESKNVNKSQQSPTIKFFKSIDFIPNQRSIQNQIIGSSSLSPQELNHCYRILQANPREDYATIVDKFITLKRRYIKRSFYLPNKKEYLQQLDRSFSTLYYFHQKHSNIDLNSHNEQIRKMSHKQQNNIKLNLQIQEEMKQKRQQFNWQFMTNNKIIIATMYGLVFICGGLQYFLFRSS